MLSIISGNPTNQDLVLNGFDPAHSTRLVTVTSCVDQRAQLAIQQARMC